MRTRFQAFMLWLCTLIGGMICGAGLFLLIQLRIVRHLRLQVDALNAVERFVGRMTFLWRDLDQKLVLALSEIPEEYLQHSERAAWIMSGVGCLGVAIILPFFLRRRFRRRGV